MKEEPDLYVTKGYYLSKLGVRNENLSVRFKICFDRVASRSAQIATL
jgi:hypothetical protein